MAVLTRQQFDDLVRSADLSDREVRQRINGIVLNEVLDTRHQTKHWEVQGFAPLGVSGQEYLRPCARVVLGDAGWQVTLERNWFCD